MKFCDAMFKSHSDPGLAKKIESSRRDKKSNRGDFLIFVFPRAFIEASAFIRVDGEMRQLPAYFDDSADHQLDLFQLVSGSTPGLSSLALKNPQWGVVS